MRSFLIAVLALLFLTPSVRAEQPLDVKNFQPGQEYFELPAPRVLAEPEDGRIEVVAFFWYNCGTCYMMDPQITDWAKTLPADVKMVRLPFAYNPTLEVHARIFFTLEALGLGHEADLTVFRLFQDLRQPVHEPSQLPRLAKALKIDEKKLVDAYNSPAMDIKMSHLNKLMDAYKLQGVPSMVINGKYLFDIGTSHGPDGYFKLAEMLIDRERQAAKK
ncbi:MAG: thiol:disulfide interchange protein DsbA/DsbL [Candidatus Adiutrix sp.]|jgi:thiol:disulfide interchange protein DsbA|nr:thiol:disulfide interchange protein DsbA/DsbL [Candidatus Adiutrix sp.]